MKDYQSENINALSLFSVSFSEEKEVQITWVIPVRLMQKFESFGLISGFTYCWKVSSCNKRTRHSAAARYVACKAPSLACQQLKGNSGYLSCWRQKRVCTSPANMSLLTAHHEIPNGMAGWLSNGNTSFLSDSRHQRAGMCIEEGRRTNCNKGEDLGKGEHE